MPLKTGINETMGDKDEISFVLGLFFPQKPILTITFMHKLSEGVESGEVPSRSLIFNVVCVAKT